MNETRLDFFKKCQAKYGERFVLDTDRFPDYARDASEIKVKPTAIFFAENEAEVVQIINECRANDAPIIFRGAGTGYTGGAVPTPGALILSLERLKKLEVNPETKVAVCGPGVITAELMQAAEKCGLFYPPDPASYDESTLGGNVAECAGGLHCKKYGVTKDYVIGLRAVTAGGEILETGIYAESELFDLSWILIGSEGILAAVTEIAVRLIDRPDFGPTILAVFNSPEDAARAVAEITRRGIVPSVMEYMDGDAIECSNKYEKTIDIEYAEAILLFETAGIRCQAEAENITKICRENRSIFLRREENNASAERLWKIRRNLSKAVKESARFKIAEDVCVPPSRLPELVHFVKELNAELPVRVNSYGHAGDGNLHVNFLLNDDKYFRDGSVALWTERLFKKTLSLDGTLTGEHGIGLTKKDYLHLEFDEPTLSSMRAMKSLFDPVDTFNPGKMFN
jgi:glycolate oxidase